MSLIFHNLSFRFGYELGVWTSARNEVDGRTGHTSSLIVLNRGNRPCPAFQFPTELPVMQPSRCLYWSVRWNHLYKYIWLGACKTQSQPYRSCTLILSRGFPIRPVPRDQWAITDSPRNLSANSVHGTARMV